MEDPRILDLHIGHMLLYLSLEISKKPKPLLIQTDREEAAQSLLLHFPSKLNPGCTTIDLLSSTNKDKILLRLPI
jgi:hypothetical protein